MTTYELLRHRDCATDFSFGEIYSKNREDRHSLYLREHGGVLAKVDYTVHTLGITIVKVEGNDSGKFVMSPLAYLLGRVHQASKSVVTKVDLPKDVLPFIEVEAGSLSPTRLYESVKRYDQTLLVRVERALKNEFSESEEPDSKGLDANNACFHFV